MLEWNLPPFLPPSHASSGTLPGAPTPCDLNRVFGVFPCLGKSEEDSGIGYFPVIIRYPGVVGGISCWRLRGRFPEV